MAAGAMARGACEEPCLNRVVRRATAVPKPPIVSPGSLTRLKQFDDEALRFYGERGFAETR